MSVESDMFYISVIGLKANVTRMLNEAIRQEGVGDIIVDGDDIETVNRKLIGKDGKPGLMVTFAELFDEKSLEDDVQLKEKWKAAVERQKQQEASGESSDYEYESRLELFKVEENDSGSYEVKFSDYMDEAMSYCECIDWAGWEDIARVYKCRIFLDNDEYYNGAFWRFYGATVYEPVKGGVSMNRFEPRLNLEEYKKVFDELIEINPKRYRSKKILDFEDKITRMQNEVYREKINIILSDLREYNPITDPIADPIDIPGDIIRIPSCAFNSSKDIGWANFHEGTVRIGDNAFLECYALVGVDLPSTLREIGSGAFKDCVCLSDVDFPEGLKEIGDKAFNGCQSLEKIVLPASLESLGRDAFKGCNLKSIKVQSGNEYWYSRGNCLLDKEDNTLLLGCKKSVIPKCTSAIADGAFYGCAGLKSIVIPSGVTSIGNHSFRDCTDLKHVVIPETVTHISGWAFMGCTSLTTVELPDGVSIDEGAFKGCPCEKEIMKKH